MTKIVRTNRYKDKFLKKPYQDRRIDNKYLVRTFDSMLNIRKIHSTSYWTEGNMCVCPEYFRISDRDSFDPLIPFVCLVLYRYQTCHILQL